MDGAKLEDPCLVYSRELAIGPVNCTVKKGEPNISREAALYVFK